jgi:citrate synthase
VTEGAIAAADLMQIKSSADEPGLLSFDPGFRNTASCRSRITFIDGERSVLRYRGYPIEQLASHSHHLETAYLLIHGELPCRHALDRWTDQIEAESEVPAELIALIGTFPPSAHPMGVLVSAIGALSTHYPDARVVEDPESVERQVVRLIAKMPGIAAVSGRHRGGLSYAAPPRGTSYAGRVLAMVGDPSRDASAVHPVFEKALDTILLLHADLEQNCSANVMRCVASSLGDPYNALAAATAALSGPRHGGANERVLEQLRNIGSLDRVPELLARVKERRERLMGFGHRVYRNYDPRARILRQLADEVFAVTGPSPLLEVARELERVALQDEFFVKRRLYPNVDFYSGIILDAMGFPQNEFTVLFAIARTAGWLAQYREFLQDPEQGLARPRQIYVGEPERGYVPLDER